jgi:hypothetical protein
MDGLEDLLRRIRDPRECTELLLDAPRAGRRGVARQVAAVLSSLPAVHRELAVELTAEPGRRAAVGELVRRVGALELVLLSLAGQQERRVDRALRRQGFERVASLVLLALLCTTLAGVV